MARLPEVFVRPVSMAEGQRLQGGVAYTPEALRWIFADLTEVELRRMRDEPADSPRFGEQFLWTALFRHDG